LNTLIDPLSGWELLSADGINDAGQIIGIGLIGGENRAYLLTPVPEPATWLMLVLGVPWFARHRLGKKSPAHTNPLQFEPLEDRRLLSFNALVKYPIAGPLHRLVAGDFNGDNTPDLIGGYQTPTGAQGGTSSVLLGNADGTFQTARDTRVNIGGEAVFADFNRDGNLDVATHYGPVGVLLANGDGTFRHSASFITRGNYDDGLAAGDVRGDGNPDIVAGSYAVILYGNEETGYVYGGLAHYVDVWLGDGAGGFHFIEGDPSNWPAIGSGPALDFNSDGNPDGLITEPAIWDDALGQYMGGSVSVLLGDGAGGFQSPLVVAAEDGLVSAAAQDFNHDGLPDVAVGNVVSGRVSILINDGDWPDARQVGDADGDQDVDGADFLAWQRGFGAVSPEGTHATGDADYDHDVDSADLAAWTASFGDAVIPAPTEVALPSARAASSSTAAVDAAFAMDQLLAESTPRRPFRPRLRIAP
jgi:hypothetical protein